jgi:hypothetical protein
MNLKNLLKSAAFILAISTVGAENANAGCGEFYDHGGYTVIRNTCGRTITFRWRDQGSCSGGCAARISGGSEQTVTSPRGSYHIFSED